jgi:hypothetical protein
MSALKLRWPKTEEIKDLGVWLAAFVICSLTPIWGSVLLLIFSGNEWSLLELIGSGQLGLIATSLLGSLFYLLFRDIPPFRFPYRWALGPIALGLVLICAFSFAAPLLGDSFNSHVIAWTTAGLLFWSICLTLIAMIIDQQIKGIVDTRGDIPQEKQLASQFAELRKKQGP